MHELTDFVLQSIFCSILNPLRLILSLKAYSQMSFSLLYMTSGSMPLMIGEKCQILIFLYLYVAGLQEAHFPKEMEKKSFQCGIGAIFT